MFYLEYCLSLLFMRNREELSISDPKWDGSILWDGAHIQFLGIKLNVWKFWKCLEFRRSAQVARGRSPGFHSRLQRSTCVEELVFTTQPLLCRTASHTQHLLEFKAGPNYSRWHTLQNQGSHRRANLTKESQMSVADSMYNGIHDCAAWAHE